MSEVRGECMFCKYEKIAPGEDPCSDCVNGESQWSATEAGLVALRLEADLAAAQSQVQRVREALGILEPADDLTECGDQTYYNGVWAAIGAVDAALDQEEVVGGGN